MESINVKKDNITPDEVVAFLRERLDEARVAGHPKASGKAFLALVDAFGLEDAIESAPEAYGEAALAASLWRDAEVVKQALTASYFRAMAGNRSLYLGTVPEATVKKRRAKNKAARESRRRNRD